MHTCDVRTAVHYDVTVEVIKLVSFWAKLRIILIKLNSPFDYLRKDFNEITTVLEYCSSRALLHVLYMYICTGTGVYQFIHGSLLPLSFFLIA